MENKPKVYSNFEVKIKYVLLEDGKRQKHNDIFIFHAYSFTEAETYAIEYMKNDIQAEEYIITNIKGSKVTEFIKKEEPIEMGIWYLIRVNMIEDVELDDVSGKTKQKSYRENMLVYAKDLKSSINMIEEHMTSICIDYEIDGGGKTKITNIFK